MEGSCSSIQSINQVNLSILPDWEWDGQGGGSCLSSGWEGSGTLQGYGHGCEANLIMNFSGPPCGFFLPSVKPHNKRQWTVIIQTSWVQGIKSILNLQGLRVLSNLLILLFLLFGTVFKASQVPAFLRKILKTFFIKKKRLISLIRLQTVLQKNNRFWWTTYKFPEAHGFHFLLNFIFKSREEHLGGKVLRHRLFKHCEEMCDEPPEAQNPSSWSGDVLCLPNTYHATDSFLKV